MEFKSNLLKPDTVISYDNVQSIAEYLSIISLKNSLRFFCNNYTNTLYKNLITDITHKSLFNYQFSSSYDFVMDAVCFLCSHVNKRLNDFTTVIKYGKQRKATVLQSCCIIINRNVAREIQKFTKHQSIYDLNYDIPTVNIIEYDEQEWLKIDKTISLMNLSDIEEKSLDCFLSGQSLAKTGRLLSRAVSSIYECRQRIQKKYLNVIKL